VSVLKPIKPHAGDFWSRWWRRPQSLQVRRLLFQIHLWSGIGFGAYIFLISLTGSLLVYRNELLVWATPADPADGSISLGFRPFPCL
jgi:hypothetical protein